MEQKKPILFDKFTPVNYRYQKIMYCKKCGRYTSIENITCPKCGHNNLITMDKHNERAVKMRSQADLLIMLALFFVSIIVARSKYEIALSIGAGVFFTIILILIHKKYMESEKALNLYKIFTNSFQDIKQGLDMDEAKALKKMKDTNFKQAYEDLREIGVLLQDDRIKENKLLCLSNFVLRKDEDLELDSLILSYYSPILVNYIDEVLKLNRTLVRRNVIDYIIKYEGYILQMKNGQDILGNVAGAAVNSKQNIILYKDFIMRYIDVLPKDRIVRLHNITRDSNLKELNDIYAETREVIDYRFGTDNDIKKIMY
jgi:hypothetical protein